MRISRTNINKNICNKRLYIIYQVILGSESYLSIELFSQLEDIFPNRYLIRIVRTSNIFPVVISYHCCNYSVSCTHKLNCWIVQEEDKH